MGRLTAIEHQLLDPAMASIGDNARFESVRPLQHLAYRHHITSMPHRAADDTVLQNSMYISLLLFPSLYTRTQLHCMRQPDGPQKKGGLGVWLSTALGGSVCSHAWR